jgi:hypothetical protein
MLISALLSLYYLFIPFFTIEREKGFAVVELFTSQGCHACPAADRMLASFPYDSLPQVYFLAYHVDYWDHLGWEDVFSQSDFSDYQREYSLKLNEQVYTPQMIVNGKYTLVGSHKKEMFNYINKVSKKKAAVNIELEKIQEEEEDELKIKFKVEPELSRHRLNVALVLISKTVAIEAGENEGETIKFTHIVREVEHSNQAEGDVEFELPQDMTTEEFEIIAYYQDKRSYTIKGASRLKLK